MRFIGANKGGTYRSCRSNNHLSCRHSSRKRLSRGFNTSAPKSAPVLKSTLEQDKVQK